MILATPEWTPQPSALAGALALRLSTWAASCLFFPLVPPGQDPLQSSRLLAPGEPAGAGDDAACQDRRLMAGPLLAFPALSSTV